jgi:hypothetical protein
MGVLEETRTNYLSGAPRLNHVFIGSVSVVHHFSILCCVIVWSVFVLCLVCLMFPVSLD